MRDCMMIPTEESIEIIIKRYASPSLHKVITAYVIRFIKHMTAQRIAIFSAACVPFNKRSSIPIALRSRRSKSGLML